MVIKAVTAGPFLGINNRLPAEKLAAGDKGAFLRDAVNVDLNDAGALQRRKGATAALAAARGRGLWSDGDTGYYADGAMLKSFDGTSAAVVAQLQDPYATPSFAATPRGIVWSDGQALELIEGGASRPLSVPTPNPEPVVTIAGNGALPAGTYLIAFADVNAAGERSVLTPFIELDVPKAGAIGLALAAGRTLDTQVFVSACGGDQLFRETTVPAGDTTARISQVLSAGQAITDEVEAPMPAGSMVRFHFNKLLTVVDNVIYHSQPFAYGVYRPAKGFVLLDGPVTLCEPVEGGVYLATARQTWFAPGADFGANGLRKVGSFGAVRNTAARDPSEPNETSVWWFSDRGAVKGSSTGAAELKQDANIAFGKASEGTALYREEDGMSQVIFAIANQAAASAARN